MMILRLSWLWDARHVIKTNVATAIKPRTRPCFIHAPQDRGTSRKECYLLPDNRPMSRAKNLAESTSTATFVLGTNLSRNTGDVLVLARVGADPRIGMFAAAASFSIPGRRRKSPATGLYPRDSPAVSSPVVSTSM